MPIPVIYAVWMVVSRLAVATYHAAQDKQTRGAIYLAAMIISGGTVFYRVVEGWAWLDAFYFTVITLTTVGYGDLSPQTPLGKLFTVAYLLLGLGLIGSFLAIIGSRSFTTHSKDVLSEPVHLPSNDGE